jgi:hypothetical protein
MAAEYSDLQMQVSGTSIVSHIDSHLQRAGKVEGNRILAWREMEADRLYPTAIGGMGRK